MTFAPQSLLDARAYLKPLTGLSSVELGIAGDTDHADGGTSYHLGADQLRDDAYSARTARDLAGLTDAASALDIGMFARLRELSIWLVAQCRANAADTRDIREVIYSPDGKVVWRWDRERGVTSLPRTGEADSSHLTHTHVSWYRDSEFRDRTAVFRRFFGGIDMPLKDDPDFRALINRVDSIIDMDATNPVGDALKPEENKLATAIKSTQLAAVTAEQHSQVIVANVLNLVEKTSALLDEVQDLKNRPAVEVTDEQLERVVRKVLGGLDGATPQS